MFENFSFAPSSTGRVMPDHDSDGLISPLSSRCPSPKSFDVHQPAQIRPSRASIFRSSSHHLVPAPTSVPCDYHDRRHYPYCKPRLSISTLTRKLHEHTLDNAQGTDNPTSVPGYTWATEDDMQAYFITPPDTDDDGASSMASLSPRTPSFGRLTPPPTTPDNQQRVRAGRQYMSRLQCGFRTAADAAQHVLEMEQEEEDEEEEEKKSMSRRASAAAPFDPFCENECHPSSIPARLGPRHRKSTCRGSNRRTATRSSRRSIGTEATSGTADGAWRLCDLYSSTADSCDRRRSANLSDSNSGNRATVSNRIGKSHYCGRGSDARNWSEQGLRFALASVAGRPRSPG